MLFFLVAYEFERNRTRLERSNVASAVCTGGPIADQVIIAGIQIDPNIDVIGFSSTQIKVV